MLGLQAPYFWQPRRGPAAKRQIEKTVLTRKTEQEEKESQINLVNKKFSKKGPAGDFGHWPSSP